MALDQHDLDQLWDFAQPAISEARFRAALAGTGDPLTALVLRTQVARALGLQGRFDECAAELAAVDAALPDVDAPSAGADGPSTAEVRVRLALERGRMLRSSGRAEQAAPPFTEALEQARAAGLGFLTGDAAHMLALLGPPEEQLRRADEALDIVATAADPGARYWIGPIENNRGWTLHGLDRHGEALASFERALTAYQSGGDPERIRIARWTVARGLRAVGRLTEALAIQRDLEANGPADGYVHEELAELLNALGHPDEAARQAELARSLLDG